MHTKLMLLLDFDYYKIRSYKELIVKMVIAATLLITEKWKVEEIPTLEEWISKARYTCLISKFVCYV